MIILEGIRIQNFRNIKGANFEKKFGDLNIFIGPNNCGKTNILKAINVLSKIIYNETQKFHCGACESAKNVHNESFPKLKKIVGISYEFNENDLFNKRNDYEIKLKFNSDITHVDNEFFDELPNRMGERRSSIAQHLQNIKNEDENFNTITLICKNREIFSEHLSASYETRILEKIKNSILFCPEQRLNRYKDKSIRDYIKTTLEGALEYRDLSKLLKKLVDSKISDIVPRNIDIKKTNDFIDTIDNQGSGIRSLICLACDIMSTKEGSIILLDEPELGMNPSSKHAFLEFLLKESESKQIFISTHDPTFVNPTLWRNFKFENNRKPKVSIFLYSLVEGKFVNVDLNQNKHDPETFGGYLPHTTSLKEKHIYVEGASDVYIFQIFLQKYLKNTHKKNWFVRMNKIGIFHFGGGFCGHLLYTIPKNPYKSLIILDGDKRDKAKSVCDEYERANFSNIPDFRFCESLEDIEKCLEEGDPFPIYCLEKECIEKYLDPERNCKSSNYDKKKGAKTAEEMKKVPEEIKKLFEIFVKS